MSKIVYRIGGSTSVVEAAAIKNVEDLAYAMGFLANHRLYKMSKTGGVTVENAEAVATAFIGAAQRFADEVLGRLEPEEMAGTISDLGLGKVINPYAFVN